jgi:hypothetical protein
MIALAPIEGKILGIAPLTSNRLLYIVRKNKIGMIAGLAPEKQIND